MTPPNISYVPCVPISLNHLLTNTPNCTFAEDLKCKLTIRTTGKGVGNTDHWSWGQFWEVGVALVGVCVGVGKEGVETGLGEFLCFFSFLISFCLFLVWGGGGWIVDCGEGRERV